MQESPVILATDVRTNQNAGITGDLKLDISKSFNADYKCPVL